MALELKTQQEKRLAELLEQYFIAEGAPERGDESKRGGGATQHVARQIAEIEENMDPTRYRTIALAVKADVQGRYAAAAQREM